MNNLLAPVVLFVYNRPEETYRVLNSLKQNILAGISDLYVFSDAPKRNEDKANVEAVRKIVHNTDGFNSVTVIEAGHNKGLSGSVIGGVGEIIRKHGKAIVLEDDLLTSPNFLSYMNQSLDYYQSNREILSVSGFSFDIPVPESYRYDVYFTHRICSYGWGTWKDRWQSVDWEVKDYRSFRYNIKKHTAFMRGGEDLPRMLAAYMRGKIDSWAVRFTYHQYKTNTYTVYPVKTMVDNIGFNQRGSNTKRRKYFDKVRFLPSHTDCFSFAKEVIIDKKINREFLKKYRNINRIISKYILK